MEVHGKAIGSTPLILLHGFTGSAYEWLPLLPRLVERTTVVVLDLVGHARSTAPGNTAPYAYDACVAQLQTVAHALGIQQGDWLGYSMGGRIALGLAVAVPRLVRRLILEGVSPGIADPGERSARRNRDEELAATIEREGVEAFVDHWLSQPLFSTQRRLGAPFMARARKARLLHSATGLANCLRGLGPGAQPPLHEHLSDVTCPSLLISGGLDHKFTTIMDSMATAMPRAHRVTIPGAGHAVHLERPEAFLTAVLPFLAIPSGEGSRAGKARENFR